MKIKETEGKQGNLKKKKNNYEVLLRKYSLVWIHKYVLWKRMRETWYFSEFCRSQRGLLGEGFGSGENREAQIQMQFRI